MSLYQISASGKASLLGELIPIETGEWYLSAENLPASLVGTDFKDGLYPGWPWFVEDLRPSGFLGRAFARRMAGLFGLSENPEEWTTLEMGATLSGFGDNMQGNYIVGERSLEAFHKHKLDIAEGYYRNNSAPSFYGVFAERALSEGETFGSSAAGEQPKFTTMVCETPESDPRAVIVKFSSQMEYPVGMRWADLLLAEHLANGVLGEHGFQVARTRITESVGRRFLESERFDRIGSTGRRGVVTLRVLDAAFVGQGSGSWADCAEKLSEMGVVSAEDLDLIRRLNAFGDLIGNTDMHFGNLSFFLDESMPLSLCPVYDMLPMLFRPEASGEIRDRSFAPTLPKPENETAWLAMLPVALQYWQLLQNEYRLSESFRGVAGDVVESLKRLSKVAGA